MPLAGSTAPPSGLAIVMLVHPATIAAMPYRRMTLALVSMSMAWKRRARPRPPCQEVATRMNASGSELDDQEVGCEQPVKGVDVLVEQRFEERGVGASDLVGCLCVYGLTCHVWFRGTARRGI
jgi:hypothetical protein